MISKHGAHLLPKKAQKTLVRECCLMLTLLTPTSTKRACCPASKSKTPRRWKAPPRTSPSWGSEAVLIQRRHLSGEATDLLYADGLFHWFSAPRIETTHTHGTGCTYSAAITAETGQGVGLVAAIETAKRYITRAIETNPGLAAVLDRSSQRPGLMQAAA